MPRKFTIAITALMIAALAGPATSQTAERTWPQQRSATATIANVTFADGSSLPEVKMAYTTLGTLRRDASGRPINAVLLLHSTSGVGKNWFKPETADPLFGSGKPLDASKYFIIIPDALGRGGSSKPSDGLKGNFPHYRYRDMILLEHRLLTEVLGVSHLRLVLGVSMGGMHSWMWPITYPDFMDAAVPINSQPVALNGRNWMMRQVTINAIRGDPDWNNGNYTTPPKLWTITAPALSLMMESSVNLQAQAPNPARGREWVLRAQREAEKTDANDVLWGREAAEDYDPAPGINRIKARLLAINFADDDVNPPHLRTVDAAVQRIPNAKYLLIPAGPKTRGHLSYVDSSLWAPALAQFLDSLPQSAAR